MLAKALYFLLNSPLRHYTFHVSHNISSIRYSPFLNQTGCWSAGGMSEKSGNGMSAFKAETTSGETTSSSNGVVTRSAKSTRKTQNGAATKRRKAAASNGRTVKAAAVPRDSSGTDGLRNEPQEHSKEQIGKAKESEATPDERELASIDSL